MSSLICPTCKNSTMKWVDKEINDLDNGLIKCQRCGAEFKGMVELHKIYMKKSKSN